ncbi:hypothetical protein IWW45_005988, partial [Coemansia sp. RSA 485]
MSGPTKPFDPFGSAAALAAAETKNHKSSSTGAKASGFRARSVDKQDSPASSVTPGISSAESSSPTSPTATAINTNMTMSSVVTASNSSNSSTTSSESVSTNTGNVSSVTASATSDSVFASGSTQKLAEANQPLKHSSIFEIGGDPFAGDHSTVASVAAATGAGTGASASSRLGRIVGASNNAGASMSTTSSPMGMLPLGPIMGSPHSLFNDSTYGVAGPSTLSLASARGGHTPSSAQLGHTKVHRLSQSRFNNILGDTGLQPSIIGRVGDKDAVSNHMANGAGQGVLDMSAGMLDSMKSLQASPSNTAQTSFKDFYVKSLPVSRRNSQEFQDLWQELEGFSINDNSTHPAINIQSILPSHMAGLDGHSVAARNSSGAFRNEDSESAALLGTSPKLPQGLLDDDMLSIKPKQTNADMAAVSAVGAGSSGMHRGSTTNLAHVASGVDLASAGLYNNAGNTAFSSIAANASTLGALAQQNVANNDTLGADNIGDLRMYDSSRGVNLIRNASTPVLNTKQYQVLQTSEGMNQSTAVQGRGGPAYADANGMFDVQSQMYGNTQYQSGFTSTASGTPGAVAGNEIAGGRHHPAVSNYPYSANAQGMAIGRNHSFVINHHPTGGSAMQMVNGGYGGQTSFGLPNAVPAGGMYGVGHQSVPPTPHQHPHHGSSHVHIHTQQLQQQKPQQQKTQPQRPQLQKTQQQKPQQQPQQQPQRQIQSSHQLSSASLKQPATTAAASASSAASSASGQQSNQVGTHGAS